MILEKFAFMSAVLFKMKQDWKIPPVPGTNQIAVKKQLLRKFKCQNL